MKVTDEMIAAFADGELDGADKARVEAAIAADPALARQVEVHLALKARLSAHYGRYAEGDLPTRLSGLLQEGPEQRAARTAEVFGFAAARQQRRLAPFVRRWAPYAGPALAASLVLAFWQPWQSAAPEGYAGTNLAGLLDTQLVADQPADAPTRILLSFEREGGGLCRAYRGEDVGGIACRDGTGWKIEQQFAIGTAAAGGEFRQAGSEAELLAAAQEMAAGGALDAADERAAQERGWQQQP